MKLSNFIKTIEEDKTPFFYYFGSFVFFFLLRNFLEFYSDDACFDWRCLSHFDLSFIWIWTAFIILFHLITGEKIKRLARPITLGFAIIVLPPIADILLGGGDMTYLFPEEHSNIFIRYLTFWGPLKKGGATFGIRLEVFIVMMGSIYFVKGYKKQSGLKAIICAFSAYTLIFLYGMMPFFLKDFLGFFGLDLTHHPTLFRNFFLLGFIPNLILLLFFYNRVLFVEILKDLRYLRMAHYQLIFVLGALLAHVQTKNVLLKDMFSPFDWIFISLAIFFACLFSLITNNFADIEIDKISNIKRPLVGNKIDTKDYQNLAWISLVLAAVYSLSVSVQVFFFIFLFIGGYLIYSMPPLRLKRVPLFSKFLLALNSLFIFYLGFYFISGKRNLSLDSMLIFLVGFTLILNFIDIKDYHGDKASGIKTLPTILGLQLSKRIIGFIFLLVIPCSFLWFNSFVTLALEFLFPLTFIGIMEYYFLTKKNYQEAYVFLTYQLPLLGFLVYLSSYHQ